MLDVATKDSVPSSTVLILPDQQAPCCMWRTNPWTQQRFVPRTPLQTTLTSQSVCPATCLALPTPKSCVALLAGATSEASCWKRRNQTSAQHGMRSMFLGPGRLATRCSTSHTPHAPDCSGISIGWWRCCASSSGIADQSPYDLPANRLRKRVPACGPGRTYLQAGQPTFSGVTHWQKARARRRQSDVSQ